MTFVVDDEGGMGGAVMVDCESDDVPESVFVIAGLSLHPQNRPGSRQVVVLVAVKVGVAVGVVVVVAVVVVVLSLQPNQPLKHG